MTHSGAPCHGSQQAAVDFYDLFHSLTGDPIPCSGPRVRGDNNAALEAECKRRRAVSEFDRTVRVCVVISKGAKEG